MIRRSTAGLLLCFFLLTILAGCAGSAAEPDDLLTGTNSTDAAAGSNPMVPTAEAGSTALPSVPTAAAAVTTETAEVISVPTTEMVPSLAETTDTTEPTDTPETSETPDPSETEPDPVEEMLIHMSLEEKVAQMFIAAPETLTGASEAVTKADETLLEALDRIPVGGVLLMGCNLKNPDQVRALCAGLQAASRGRVGLPLFLCVDEEGGSVARISGNPDFGVEKIPAMSKVDDPETARSLGRTMGAYLRDLGLNVDFAPVADVLTNPENQVVKNRSFGSDPEQVTELAGALADGLLAEGVLPCWKHFPGHGGTAEDSHKGFAVLHLDPRTPEESPELQPFLAAAEAGAPMIMTGHIAVPELDPEGLPASLSPTLLALLRGPDRDYDGLLVTDALGMGAITERFSPGEAAVLAVLAGNDLLLASDELEPAYEAVLAAVRDGTISEARIDESVYRILRTKNDLP